MAREFKVELVTEGGCGTLLLGSSGLPLEKMEAVLNRYGAEGWNMDFMVIEAKRYLLFWTREAAIITFSRELS